jgi:alpha-galactosidase
MLLALLACSEATHEACQLQSLEASGDTLTLRSTCGSWNATGSVLGEGELSLELVQQGQQILPVVRGSGTLEALVLEGPVSLDGTQTPVLWKQGYQSWWWSGVTELSPIEFEDGLPRVGGDGDGLAALDETAWSSWWVGLLGRRDGASLLIGALSAATTKWTVSFQEDHAWAVWGNRGERIPVDGELQLDGFTALMGEDPWALHADYAQIAATAQGLEARSDLPHTGWATWTVVYEDLDEDFVRTSLAAMPEELHLVQLDDGWQKAWGDWSPNERFPGWDSLASDIAAAGHQPGLWMAPFYVERELLYEDHPDWFVHDEDGQPLSYSNFGDHDYLVLDVTHTEAAAHFQQNLRDRVDEGWTYFKLDFLYAGMQEGVRHQPMSGAQAYARAMELTREALGDEAFFLACGAPMLPSLGTADGFRTGADIAFAFSPDGQPGYLRWQGRATAARAWQNGTWWWIDADQIILRAPIEPSGALVAGLVSGGAWIFGDAVEDLDARFVDPELLALLGQAAEPVDPLSFTSGPDASPLAEQADPNDQVPTCWRFPSGEVALLNLGESAVEVEGPGGTELLSGETAEAGKRTLSPGQGELWRP